MTEEEAAEEAECVWGEGGEESRARAAVREELARLCGSGRVGCGVVVCCGVVWETNAGFLTGKGRAGEFLSLRPKQCCADDECKLAFPGRPSGR